MGFNASRRYRDAKGRDVALLIVGTLVILAALGWAAGVF